MLWVCPRRRQDRGAEKSWSRTAYRRRPIAAQLFPAIGNTGGQKGPVLQQLSLVHLESSRLTGRVILDGTTLSTTGLPLRNHYHYGMQPPKHFRRSSHSAKVSTHCSWQRSRILVSAAVKPSCRDQNPWSTGFPTQLRPLRSPGEVSHEPPLPASSSGGLLSFQKYAEDSSRVVQLKPNMARLQVRALPAPPRHID